MNKAQRPLGHHQKFHYVLNGHLRMRGGKRAERTFEEMMAKNFLNLMKSINPHIQEDQFKKVWLG